jgi:hypothetical protein
VIRVDVASPKSCVVSGPLLNVTVCIDRIDMAEAIGALRHLEERNTNLNKCSVSGVRCHYILLSCFTCLKSAIKCNYTVRC